MKETIICSAIWYKDHVERATHRPINTPGGVVICGYRHGHCIATFVALTGKRSVITEAGEYVQGFLTNKNRFVDRKEASQIHIENGGKLNYSKTDLYSEDLY